jgi:nucleotide-binding universal stress UspA family protein
MLVIKHILFPMDFSDRCCAAVPFAAKMATRFNAKITLLSAASPFWFMSDGYPGGSVVIDMDEILRDLKTRLEDAAGKEFASLPVDTVAALGDPAQLTVGYANSHGADLIMMPTHGYGPFRSLLLGSVTAKVLHDAQCPVWTAAHMEEPPAKEHLECRAILCAVDATPKSVPLMKWAAELSQATGATLRLVHVIPGMEGWPSREMDRQFEEDMRQEARQQITHHETAASVEAPLCVTVGNIAEGVREEARRHGADLIVIGRGMLHETLGRLRTHAYGIIRHSPCPVLSV